VLVVGDHGGDDQVCSALRHKQTSRKSVFVVNDTMTLLDLPNELIVQILSYLARKDLISCQLSNTALYTVINASVLLQFQIALSTFKATDNPSSSLSLSERLQALKGSENAWTFLRKDFNRRIAVNFEVSGIYDLNGGVFLLGNVSQAALHYIKLPSSIEDDIEWKKIRLDPSEGSIIDMGFCIPEHDLMTVVTT
jgi:F-box-like